MSTTNPYEEVYKMAGKIKMMIDNIIEKNSNGNELLAEMTKTKIIMKGINPRKYNDISEDDQNVLEELNRLAKNLGINI